MQEKDLMHRNFDFNQSYPREMCLKSKLTPGIYILAVCFESLFTLIMKDTSKSRDYISLKYREKTAFKADKAGV